MRRLVIIKAGSTIPSLRQQPGDFRSWILAGMNLSATDPRVSVVDVTAGQPLPDYDGLAGVVVTGSHEMVTDRLPWSERTAAWLPGLADRRIPTLGICFGHQLLAHAFGGEVAANPRGRSFGSIDVTLCPEAAADPLLGGLPSPMKVYVSHTQSVTELPPGAKRLATSLHDPNHAFVIAGCMWGVQCHPEFDAEIATAYLKTFGELLEADGQDPRALAAACARSSPAAVLLSRFGRLVQGQLS